MDVAVPDVRVAQEEARREKVFAAEKNTAGVRLAIVLLNGLVYPFLDHTENRGTLAYAILGLALLYSAIVVVAQPYRRYPALQHAYFTSLSDAILITIWLWATGGFSSPYYVLWYASIVGVAFRYDYRWTLAAAGIYSLAYGGLLIGLGQAGGHAGEVVIRIAYIVFVGALAGEVASEFFRQATSKAEMRDINAALERMVGERTAQLQAVNEELESFSYSVSHDLRAPLRSMDGFSRVLMEDYAQQLDPQAQDYLQRIRAASQRMVKLIEDILQLSRLSRVQMNEQPMNLSQLANQVLDDLQQREPDRELERVIAEGIEARADPALVQVLLENLISNAWKFTSKHPRARIEVGVLPEHEQGTVYYVRDDGAGFDMAYANKLFGAFQRLHNRSEFDGTGIGLATVERIVRRHGGKVWAEAAVEQGATFYFTLGASRPTPLAAGHEAGELAIAAVGV
jgi:signal transduction histidine kinase